jgi:hypothetical protein
MPASAQRYLEDYQRIFWRAVLHVNQDGVGVIKVAIDWRVS